jgi:hypothetical protein
VELREENAAFLDTLKKKGFEIISAATYRCRVQAPGTAEALCRQIVQTAVETGAQVRGFQMAQRSLEEAFMEVIR